MTVPPSELSAPRPLSRLVPHYLYLALAELAGPFLQLLALSMVTAVLGRAEYGRVSVFLVPVQVLFLLCVSWTSPALLTFGKKEWDATGRCGAACRSRAALLASALAVVAVVLYGWADRWTAYFGLPGASLHLAFAFVAAMAASDFLRGLLQVTGRLKVYALSVTLERLFTAATVAALWFALVPGTALWAIAAMGLATVLSVLACLPWSGPREWLAAAPGGAPAGLASMLRFSAPLLLVSVGGWIVATVDVVFLKEYRSLADVGGYQFAYKMMSFLEKFGLAAGTAVGPIVIGYAAQGRTGPLQVMAERILPKLIQLWGVGLALGGVAAELLVPLCFRSEFHDAPRFLGVLMVGLAFSPFLAMYYPVYYGSEKTLRLALVTNAIGATNLVLDAALIPSLGPMGAAWATAAAYAAGVGVLAATIPLIPRAAILRQVLLLVPCLGFLAVYQGIESPIVHAGALVPLIALSAAQARAMRVYQAGDAEHFAKAGLPAPACGVLTWVGRRLGGA